MSLSFLKSKPQRKDHILAIDLGVRYTKAIHLQRKGSVYQLANFVLQDAPVYEKGLSVEVLGQHIKTVATTLGMRTKQIVLVAGVGDSIVRDAELPLSPVADLRAMIKLNSKNYLQQDLPDYIFDCFIQSMVEQRADAEKMPAKARVIVAGAKRQYVQDLQSAAKSAGLVAEHIFPSLLGPANAFEISDPEAFGRDVVALVDLGFRHSTITVLMQGKVALFRVVGIGGDKLTSGIAETMGISYAEGEGIKVGMAEEVQSIMTPLLSPLGRELRASVDFFEHQSDKAVGQVLISGGAALSDFILQTLQSDLMVPCKSWNPFASIGIAMSEDKAAELAKIAPQFVVVAGAAVSAMPPAA